MLTGAAAFFEASSGFPASSTSLRRWLLGLLRTVCLVRALGVLRPLQRVGTPRQHRTPANRVGPPRFLRSDRRGSQILQ